MKFSGGDKLLLPSGAKFGQVVSVSRNKVTVVFVLNGGRKISWDFRGASIFDNYLVVDQRLSKMIALPVGTKLVSSWEKPTSAPLENSLQQALRNFLGTSA